MKASPLEAAIERAERPALVFDRARLEANARGFADAARAHGVTTLFAAKSFPHREVREIVARHVAGFDAASEGEIEELRGVTGAHHAVLSVADPSGRAGATELAATWPGRLIVGCETVEQVRAAPARAEIAIRVSASVTAMDPAIGAVLDGSGHRRSRFGLDTDPDCLRAAIAELVAAAGGRPVGLHVHHGPITATTGDRFATTARAVLAAAHAAELAPAFLDLGGAWHGIEDVSAALATVRAAVPPELELIAEPGRAIAAGAGFACGRVLVARELDDRPLCVVDLSRICHLRWSQIELVRAAPRPGEGRTTLVVGPTCYEEDVLGEWTVGPQTLAAGARVVVRHVTGYALAWNTRFGGVPPADVILV